MTKVTKKKTVKKVIKIADILDPHLPEIIQNYENLLKTIDVPHEAFVQIYSQIYIMGGNRLVDPNIFEPSSIEGQMHKFAANNNLISDVRMKYFLRKYEEYRNGILKIEKPVEDFSNLEMSNVRGFEDPVEQRKAMSCRAKGKKRREFKTKARGITKC